MRINKQDILRDIANHLLLNAGNMASNGLFHGKMGPVLFFYLYGRYTGKFFYGDYADLLLEEVLKDLDDSMNVSLENGLAGIGWGIEYLAQNDFIEGNTGEMLEDLNLIIMKYFNPIYAIGSHLQTELEGVLSYLNTHISSCKRENPHLTFDTNYLDSLYRLISQKQYKGTVFEHFYKLSKEPWMKQERITIPEQWYRDIPMSVENFTIQSLGIYNGLSGLGIKLMCL